ncbi:MAG TPA: thioredoxin [Bryobacteraceae bacterium]|nr:thioredoxin [Bryobacteraceae bacterium]
MSLSTIRTCPSCGAQNRVPSRHLADDGRCGSCKATLPAVNSPLDVDAARFADIVREARVPILVDFWASWCAPCRIAAPEVSELARESAGRALVLKVNTEEQPEVAARFAIQSIPTFVVLRDGHVVLQRSGVAPRAEMRRWLDAASAA